ncbi:MAG: DUF4230 domain-containing protein [Deferribacteraceae bacterium]|jgi:hypothetical protein|nr:DUF4230 domain-containing protein [Deferribacteraceae bacterium]
MKRFIKILILLLILIFGIGIGIFGAKKFKILSEDTNININSTVKEILPISEYATLVYHYSDVITHSDIYKIFGKEIPFTGKKAIYTIDGTIKLGIDGNDIKVKTSGSGIIVRMPEIKILSHEIYPETFNLYDEKTGLLSNYTLKSANDIQLNHKNEREKKVNENVALFTQAKESAEQQFKSLLENMPGIKGKYRIVFEWE